jgi:transglutaminase-like putative cysteine protease
MLAIYSVPVAVHQDSVSFVPFAAGAAGFLWLLVTDNVDRIRRFGRRFTGDGRDVDLWEPSPLAAAGRRLALVGVVLAIVLPVILPGSNTGLLDKFGAAGGGGGNGPGGGNGTGSSVDMFAMLSGQLNTNRVFDMVKVQTNEPNPYYLKFGVADELTPAGFRNRTPSGGQSANAGLPPPAAAALSGVTARAYKAQVQIVSLNMRSVPVYQQPTRTEKLDSSWLYDRPDGLVYSRRGNADKKRYAFDYVRLDYSPEALRAARPLPADDPVQRRYTSVPKIAEVERKLAPIIAGKTTPYDKVRAIHSSFSAGNGFEYSLQTKSGTSGSAIVDFLDNKQGFCEQYSAAMAWLVRAAGIPARVAFGFSRGSNKTGTTWTLTNRNLHAWTEVYFERYGWVPFDATPAAFVTGVDSAWAPDPNRRADDPGATAGVDDVPRPGAPGASGSAAAGAGPHDDRLGPDGSTSSAPVSGSKLPALGLGGLAALVGLLLAPALWRGRLRRRRRPERMTGPPPVAVAVAAGPADLVVTDDSGINLARARAHAAWDELVDTMVDHRLPVDVAATPRTVSERLVTGSVLAERPAAAARLLARAEERARYARTPLPGDDLADSLRTVRAAIIDRVSRRTRIRAIVLPASVIDRWRTTVSEWSDRIADTATRRRDAVASVVNLRRLLIRPRHQ